MKAIRIIKYGSADVLRIQNISNPVPQQGELLIRVKATVAAEADCAFRRGKPVIARLFTGLTKPKHIPGDAFAGIVEQADGGVFKPGDKVYGSSGTRFGTNAELLVMGEAEAVAFMPQNMTFEEAAAVSEGALTALPFLRDHAKLKKGQHILINGAAGGVGVCAVQLAKVFGVKVTAVCGAANTELVKSLGAASVIDYTKEDFTKSESAYDVIFDAVGKSTFKKCKPVLAQNGIYMTTVPSAGAMAAMMLSPKSKGKRAVFAATGLRKPADKKRDLDFLRGLIERGALKAVIGRSFDFEQMADAHRYVETGHKRGSAVVRIG